MNMPLISRLLPLALAACAATPSVTVPTALEPGFDQRLAMVVAATGVQVYECRAANAGAAPQWAFVAPEAQLFDAQGRTIGSHGAGPHWTARDGSRLQGTVKARADAPSAGAIPWLLLATQSSGPRGSFSDVTHIQRVSTRGGVAPAGGCDVPGSVTRVPYTADYRLFRAASAATSFYSAR